jgi:putative redox protein
MTTQSVDIKWMQNMTFQAGINGHEILLDLDESAGGANLGPRPKPLLLAALGGCTGMDVISILRKMKIEPDYFNVKVNGEVTEEHPKRFTRIHLIYEFRGNDLPLDKLSKAIELSQNNYCGVSDTLKRAVELSYEINILD